jgi:Fe-S-cluster containining protein
MQTELARRRRADIFPAGRIIFMQASREQIQNALAEVRAIYAELSRRPIERNCTARTECCQFQLKGRTPQLTKGEALLAAKAFRATGRKELPEPADGACPLLKVETGRCLIYADRPFGCRTHFCAAAGGPFARKDVLDLIRRLESVDRLLGGDGPHAIESAVENALAEI